MTTIDGTGDSEGEIRKLGCGVILGVESSLPEGPVAFCPAVILQIIEFEPGELKQ